jgi:hypothetical protein
VQGRTGFLFYAVSRTQAYMPMLIAHHPLQRFIVSVSVLSKMFGTADLAVM